MGGRNIEFQLWIEWPTPGLCPGAVGRKSSMNSTLLDLIWAAPPLFPIILGFKEVSWCFFEYFLDFKCLPSAHMHSSCKRIMKRRMIKQMDKVLGFLAIIIVMMIKKMNVEECRKYNDMGKESSKRLILS